MSARPVVIAASTAALVLAVGIGAMVVARGGGAADFISGAGMNIALVAPTEPEPLDGPTMEVGPLVDGYEHREFAPEPALYEPVTAWLPEDAPLPAPHIPVWESPAPPTDFESDPSSEPVRRGRPMSFGFDEPLPDFAAERQARRERLDALEARQAEAVGGPDRIDPSARRSPEMFY